MLFIVCLTCKRLGHVLEAGRQATSATLFFDAFHAGVELEEIFIDVLVAAVDVVESGNGGGAFGGEAGEN